MGLEALANASPATKVTYFAATEWYKAYKKHPITTLIITLLMGAVIAGTLVFLDQMDKKKQEARRQINANYQEQIQQLDETENNIHQLLSFIEAQKRTLRDTEDAISQLKSEKEKLQPIVNSNKKTVEAIFRAQEERVKNSVWRERAIGFISGIGASLIASFIWFVGVYFIKGRKNSLPTG